jgi:tetratricopeptide (TPR) repeat protein
MPDSPMKKILYITLTLFVIQFSSCKKDTSSKIEKFGKTEVDFTEKGFITTYFGEAQFDTEEVERLNLEAINFAKQGDFSKARSTLLKALKIESDNPIILNNLGNVEHRLKNYQKAIDYYEISLKKSDSIYLNAALNLGLLYWKDYEFEKSARVLEYVLDKSNNDFQIGSAHYQLARTYLDNNQCSKSKSSWDEAREVFKDVEGFQTRLVRLEEEIVSCVRHKQK